MATAMDTTVPLERATAAPRVAAKPLDPRMPDDKAMLKAAADLTRALNAPNPAIYWADLIVSAVVGYGALTGAILAGGWLAFAMGVVAVLALYRAGSMIHEVSHIKHAALPGFRLGWNVLVGIPFLRLVHRRDQDHDAPPA